MPAPHSVAQRRAFLALLAAAFVVCALVIWPVWIPLFLGGVVAVVATPWHQRLVARTGGRHGGLWGLFVVAAAFVVLAGLVALLAFVVLREVVPFTQNLVHHIQASKGAELYDGRLGRLLARVGVDRAHLAEEANQLAQWAATHVGPLVGDVLSVGAHGMLTTVIAILSSYYMLVDGPRLLRFIERLSPLPVEQTRALFREFRDVSRATLYGNGVTALYQGAVSLVGYWIFRVPQAGLLASLTAVLSLIPGIGSSVLWVPIGVVLVATGATLRGLGLLAWSSVLVVLLADYWLRPRLVGGRMRLHSLLVFLSIFGGLELFGLPGLIAGPLCLSLLAALLRIYDREYHAGAGRPSALVTPTGEAIDRQRRLLYDEEPGEPIVTRNEPSPLNS